MRDLFLTMGFPPDVGGIQRLVYEVARRFDKPVVITRFFNGAEEFDTKLKNFTIYRTSNKRSLLYKFLFPFSPMLAWFFENKTYLEKAIKQDKITRIHCTHIFSGFCGVYAKWRYGIPFVVYVHCQEVFRFYYPWYNPFSWFIKNLVLKEAKRVYTITSKMAEYLSQTIDKEKITLSPLASNPKYFVPLKKNPHLVKKYDLQNKKVLLTISRLDAHKWVDVTLEALAKLVTKFTNLVYLIGGEGPDKERLESMVKELNLSKHVIFAGKVAENEILKFYNLADIYVLINRDLPKEGTYGGYGMVLLEANACEKPFVVGRASFFDATPIDGKTGLIVDPLDINDIAKALEKILTNTKYAKQLGKNGRKRVLEFSNYDNMVKVIIDNIDR